MIDLKKPTYFSALSSIVGQANLTGGSDDGPMSEIGFVEGIDKPTEEEVQTKLAELLAEYDSQEYARKRAEAYPSVGDQLDMLMKDMKNGTKTHQEACEAVKTKYPKS